MPQSRVALSHHAGTRPASSAGAATSQLSFLGTVPRNLVHRAAVTEVFLTDTVRTGDGRFSVAAQWPRDHALYYPNEQGLGDPLLFAETIRQALVYLAHEFYGVPLTHRFIGFDFDFEVTDTAPLRVGAAPLPVVLDSTWTWVGNKPPHRYGFRLDVEAYADGRHFGRGHLRVIAVDDKRYGLLRRRGARTAGEDHTACGTPSGHGLRVPSGRVGRLRDKDCVLEFGERRGEWLLRPDLDHAVLFDHPGDHVPLMVMLEGFRQLGHLVVHEGASQPGRDPASAPSTLVAAEVECLAFAELDEPIRLVLREPGAPAGPDSPAQRLAVRAFQGENVLATCSMTWAAPGSVAAGTDGDYGLRA